MRGNREAGEELFARHFRRAEAVVRAVAAYHRLSLEERQELYGEVMLKLVQDDFAALRRFRGRSSWRTYLTVIVQRVLLDRRVKAKGRWRPCVRARRLGTTAVELDRRINRDGLEPAEVVRELLVRGVEETAEELEKLVAEIPRRPRRRLLLGDRTLDRLEGPRAADERVEAGERRQAVEQLHGVLTAALRDLPDGERDLLRLRFSRGWTVRRIAAHRNLKERTLYWRFERILSRLRRRLEGVGMSWKEVAAAFEHQDVDLRTVLR